MTRHPFATHNLPERLLIVLRTNEFGNDALQFVGVCLQRTIFDVHFVRCEAQIWIEDKRCGQIIVFGQLFWRHASRLHFVMLVYCIWCCWWMTLMASRVNHHNSNNLLHSRKKKNEKKKKQTQSSKVEIKLNDGKCEQKERPNRSTQADAIFHKPTHTHVLMQDSI